MPRTTPRLALPRNTMPRVVSSLQAVAERNDLRGQRGPTWLKTVELIGLAAELDPDAVDRLIVECKIIFLESVMKQADSLTDYGRNEP